MFKPSQRQQLKMDRIFNRVSTVLQNAVDALAPPVPLLEDFIYHWKMLMKFYTNQKNTGIAKTSIEGTNIPGHLDQLLKLLLEEESNMQGEAGPCLEYFLHHHLLDLLATLACTDCPPGMKHYTLVFVQRLITQTKQPILPHVGIYKPLQRLIGLCNGMKASPTEQTEIHFLCSLCGLVCRDPHLTHVFNSSPPADVSTTEPASSSQDAEAQADKFPLLDALLSFLTSADSRVMVKACEGVMVVASLPSDELARIVAQRSDVCTVLASRLHATFQAIPPDVDPNDLDDITVKWGLDAPLWSDDTSFPGCRPVALFLAWLDYCDQLVREAHPILGSALALTLRLHFMEEVLGTALNSRHIFNNPVHSEYNQADIQDQPQSCAELVPVSEDQLPVSEDHLSVSEDRLPVREDRLPDSEDRLPVSEDRLPVSEDQLPVSEEQYEASEAVWATNEYNARNEDNLVLVTALVTKCLKQTTAPALLTEMFNWLVGDESNDSEMCEQLLDNCCHERDEVALETLRLFEVLLDKHSSAVMNRLVLNYVSGRGYYDAAAGSDVIGSWSDEEDQRERIRGLDFSPGSSPVSRTLAPSNIHKIINSWLFLVPQHLRSSSDPEESGYQQYVQDADRQYRACIARSGHNGWPLEAVSQSGRLAESAGQPTDQSDDSCSSDSRPEADHPRQFNEGPFLQTLFARLLRLPYQPYEINLQLTGLVSRLAMLPHGCLHEYLLNPALPVVDGTVTLFATLEAVVGELATQVPQIEGHRQMLRVTRQKLLGDDPVTDIQEESNGLLESLIVLEEFCKELAAIAFVKYHHSS